MDIADHADEFDRIAWHLADAKSIFFEKLVLKVARIHWKGLAVCRKCGDSDLALLSWPDHLRDNDRDYARVQCNNCGFKSDGFLEISNLIVRSAK